MEIHGNWYMTKHELPLGQLDEHLPCAKCVIESRLEFEIFNLLFGIREHYKDGLVRVCEQSCQGLSKTQKGVHAL